MASRYQRQASITRPGNSDRFSPAACALLFCLGLFTPHCVAADTAPALRPYTAQYKTTARGFDLIVTRTLEAEEGNRYVQTNGGKILVVGFHEISVFEVEQNNVRPISYVYQGTGMVSRRRELHFDAQQDQISSLYKQAWYALPYADGTLDRISQVVQLRLMLLANPDAARDVTLRVADRKRVKDSRLLLVGRETLQTPLGPIDTLHYQRLHDDAERKSDLWFAPQWDYLMVKTVHIESGDPVEMIITGATLDGQRLTAN